jgi:hypothetical protein
VATLGPQMTALSGERTLGAESTTGQARCKRGAFYAKLRATEIIKPFGINHGDLKEKKSMIVHSLRSRRRQRGIPRQYSAWNGFAPLGYRKTSDHV